MSTDYTAEFRQQVLRRVAERNDLDAVAREFHIPSDVLFGWLREAVDDGRRLGTSTPATANAVAPDASATPSAVDSEPRTEGGIATMLWIVGGSGVVFLLTGMSLGFVVASHAFHGLLMAAGTVVGLGVFCWLMRGLVQAFLDDQGVQTLFNAALMAAVIGSMCSVSVWMWTVTLPSYPHRLFRQPAQVRTTVVRLGVWHRKGGICPQVTTAVFDPRFPAEEFCIDRQQYNQLRLGQAVVLRGSVSWFGFERDSVVFVPPGA